MAYPVPSDVINKSVSCIPETIILAVLAMIAFAANSVLCRLEPGEYAGV